MLTINYWYFLGKGPLTFSCFFPLRLNESWPLVFFYPLAINGPLDEVILNTGFRFLFLFILNSTLPKAWIRHFSSDTYCSLFNTQRSMVWDWPLTSDVINKHKKIGRVLNHLRYWWKTDINIWNYSWKNSGIICTVQEWAFSRVPYHKLKNRITRIFFFV